jgi:primosomal protein N' (replication factor Y)
MVPFARRQLIGLVVSISSESTLAPGRIKSVGQVIDSSAVLAPDMLSLLIWAASYYHHPIGEVLVAALPRVLRQGAPAAIEQREIFTLEQSLDTLLPTLGRAPVQRRLVERLAASESVDATVLSTISARWRASLAPLIERSAVSVSLSRSLPLNTAQDTGPALVGEQAAALEAIVDALGQQRTFLLNGVTGSGKTEVYLQAIEAARSRGEQTLVLVPEISLTPQLMGRFAARLSGCLVSLHSGLNDTERSQAWLLASEGHADVVVGTRSAVLVPFK